MIALLKAELYKLIHQRMTYFALAAIVLIEGIVLVSAYFQGSTILEILLDNLRESFYFQGSLLNGHLIVYLILNSLWFHLPLILMIVSSGLFTTEHKDKTLQMMMMQPVSKVGFVISKYVAAITFSLIIIALLMISSMAISYSVFGTGDLIVYLGTLNFYESNQAFERILWAYACGTLTVIFFSVASVTLGIWVRDTAIAWIVSAFFLIVCNLLLKVDLGLSWYDNYFFVKLNDTWQQLFYQEIDWSLIHLNNTLLVIYILLFMAIGTFIFQKRDVA
ncbi:MAG: ABC transporter permease [Bacteroidota bacterium]